MENPTDSTREPSQPEPIRVGGDRTDEPLQLEEGAVDSSADEPLRSEPIRSDSTQPPQPVSAVVGPHNKDKPSPIHLAIALVAGLVLIAFPLVLWVGPDIDIPGTAAVSSDTTPLASTEIDLSEEDEDEDEQEEVADELPKSDLVNLGKVWIDKCEKPGPDRTPPDQCDRQPWFEQALVRAVLENTACAPQRSGTVSIVLRIDYRRRSINVFTGKSGSLRGRSTQALMKCIRRSIPDPDWSSLEHEHTRYIVAVMATYPER